MQKSFFSGFRLLLSVSAFICCSAFLQAQEVTGVPVTGDAPVVQTVSDILKRAATTVRLQSDRKREEHTTKNRQPAMSPAAYPGNRYPKSEEPPVITSQNTQAIHSNFAALHGYETPGWVLYPPDNMGDVGPTQVCIASNNRIKWYTKPSVCEAPLTTSTTSGALTLGGAVFNVFIDDFFASVSNGASAADPHVHYDRLSQRWFVVAMNTEKASNRIMIAVSNGPTIANETSFSFYQFKHDQGAAPGSTDQGQFFDYPTLGVDRNALYIGGNIFSVTDDTYSGASVYVVRKSSLLTGGPVVFTPFRGEGTSSSGIFTAQGVHNDDPGAQQGYFLGVSGAFFGVLNYIVVNNPGTTPSITRGTLNVPQTAFPVSVPALGSTNDLSEMDDRLLNAQLFRNKNTGSMAIWTAHQIGVNASGSAVTTGADRVGTRWYCINVEGSTLTLNQSGTLFDNAAANPAHFWMGSIASSGQGHAVLGASKAGATLAANAVIAGRYNGTTAGALFAPVNATNYAETYNLEPGEPSQRWGDYSQTVLDPTDDMTMWTFQQFVSGTDRWAVRAIQLKAPPPATITAMTPVTCTNDRTVDITVDGAAGTAFAGFFDPGNDPGGPGYARRLAVSSTGGVTISNVSYVNPLKINFKLNYSAAALGSAQTLTVTNPDCQSVTYNYTLPTGCASLPVTWLGAEAAWSGTAASVSWRVSNEVEVKHYEVERSSDGNRFASIGKISYQPTLGGRYVFADPQPGPANYYRIKQVDLDGSFTYSSIAVLFKTAGRKLELYPNPAQSAVRIITPEGPGVLRLLDEKGSALQQIPLSGNMLQLDTSPYARGIYYIEFTSRKGSKTIQKLVLK